MVFIKLTVHKKDINGVLDYLGKKEVIHFPESDDGIEPPEIINIKKTIDKLRSSAGYLGVTLHGEAVSEGHFPDENEKVLTDELIEKIESLKNIESKTWQEKQRVSETLNEINVFLNMNVPYADLTHLSFLTLRVGRLDPAKQPDLVKNMDERAVIIPLDLDGRILAASSKKGRFALDSELKKLSFEPIVIPEDHVGLPPEIQNSLKDKLTFLEAELEEIQNQKNKIIQNYSENLIKLESSWLVALMIEKIKIRYSATGTVYILSGWTPKDMIGKISSELLDLFEGRVAIHIYKPEQIPEIKNGSEKVPVAFKHGKFTDGFKGMVLSYGAPVYGSIDPVPMVAFFFIILFGIMFGDAGHGFVLLLAGILTGRYGIKKLSQFNKYSIPLISVGITSIIMGFLTGSVFTNEDLLITPTRAISAAITGNPVDRFLYILPISEKGGSVKKLFYFFGFTIGIGIIFNTTGLLINIINRCKMKKYEAAFFSKTGLAGMLFFWYAVFIAVRIIFGGSPELYDIICLLVFAFCIFFGNAIFRFFSSLRPVFENGLMIFFIEGFVEILETISTYVSNTVSFLRVGAFALSHTVLSYIVFRFSEELALSGPAGTITAVFIMITGNVIIIVLEGLIVAIQAVRLQYYEFFNKFFTETGIEYNPFRFRTNTT
jgi:V/A-type H+-transporting ATPase subunit I